MVDTSVLDFMLFTKDSIIMDDWKLNTAPVDRLETPSKRFVWVQVIKLYDIGVCVVSPWPGFHRI